MPGGRPSDYNLALADDICTRLANGESLRAVCRDEPMPHVGTVLRWVASNEEFREQYVKAREIQAETHADDIVTIADGSSLGGEEKVALTARDRLRVDARKWVASKLLPKKYGDKIDVEHSGSVTVHEWLSTAN